MTPGCMVSASDGHVKFGGANEEKEEDKDRMNDGRNEQSCGRREIFIMKSTASGKRRGVRLFD
jgi:hypothetical protein